jgi:hypothetical protein
LGWEALVDLEDLEVELDQMVCHHHRHQVLDPVPEHLSRKEFQREWKDEVRAHCQVVGLHLLHHRRESWKAHEAEAEKS